MPVRRELAQETWWLFYINDCEIWKNVCVKLFCYIKMRPWSADIVFSMVQTLDNILWFYASWCESPFLTTLICHLKHEKITTNMKENIR